ncbi:Nuclear aminoacylation-dependent tRNA export pathway component [Massospora cicadina]|nr:Nuclear aminoacylation-dependent tRNA export pathway component [Massospora cicadina]
MSYLSSLVSSVGNVISTTATAAANAYSGTSHKEVSNFLAGYRLHTKADDSPVTIFIHNDPAYNNPYAPASGTPAAALCAKLARQALRRLRMLRHPDLLSYRAGVGAIDSGPVYFVTERVRPVGRPLNFFGSEEEEVELSKTQRQQLLAWGLYKTGSALRFLNLDCSLVHGLVTLDCVFVNRGLEWKLGGFELLSGTSEEEVNVFRTNLAQIKSIQAYLPESLGGAVPGLDAWMFGTLIYEAFTDERFNASCALPPPSGIPAPLHATYKRLVQKDVRLRFKNTSKVLASTFFNTTLIETNEFLTQLAVKEKEEKDKFFISVLENSADFPGPFILHRLLPQLCTAVEFGSGGAGALGAIVKLGEGVNRTAFLGVVVAPLLRAFKSSDRQMRMVLLMHLPQLAPYLSPDNVSRELYPSLVTGFQDAASQLKEATVRGAICVVDKLEPRLINQDLFGHLQTLQFDAHPAVRANTLIGMGRIAAHLDASTRELKQTPSLLRSLKDPFPPARRAALQALGVTAQYLEAKILCSILSGVAPLLIDPERVVRDAAMATTEATLLKAKSPLKTVELGWAGWAVSSLSKSIVAAADTINVKAVNAAAPRSCSPDASLKTNAHHQSENLSLFTLRHSALEDDNDEEDGWGGWEEPVSEMPSTESQALNPPSPPKNQSLKSPSLKTLRVSDKTSPSSFLNKSDDNSPAKKREEYRLQLEERRKHKAAGSPTSQDSKAKPARGMSLGPRRTDVD